jgi:dihydroorotate dehydrogenase electron transfer subunit
MACGVGVCMTCVLPVIGEDGETRMMRSCIEGPVFRGDRIRWDDLGTVPSDTVGATETSTRRDASMTGAH